MKLRVFARTTPLPSAFVCELDDRPDHRIGVCSDDHLEQRQAARRIEEVGAQPPPPKLDGPSLGDARERDARGVGRHDRRVAGRPLHAFHQRLLDIEALDHGFHHPVASPQAGQIVETAGSNERGGVPGMKTDPA